MADSVPSIPSPNSATILPLLPPLPPPPLAPPPPSCHPAEQRPAVPSAAGGRFSSFRCPAMRVTSEFDSESSVFFHKVSCKLFDSLAKIKFSFQNDRGGQIAYPQLGFLTKHFCALYDLESHNALLKGSFDIANFLQVRATHDVKPKTTVQFPLGEVSVERKDQETEKALSISGILKGELLNGVCTALYGDEDLSVRYCYKVIISLPPFVLCILTND
ncbi:hypothetical protein BHM03_00024205 [Ensete ventricosum]|nr:hypothetical protein BHM03_00024205 [Ensete ventricosum]